MMEYWQYWPWLVGLGVFGIVYVVHRLGTIFEQEKHIGHLLARICDQLERLNGQALFIEAAERKWHRDMAEMQAADRAAERREAHEAQMAELLRQKQEAPK